MAPGSMIAPRPAHSRASHVRWESVLQQQAGWHQRGGGLFRQSKIPQCDVLRAKACRLQKMPEEPGDHRLILAATCGAQKYFKVRRSAGCHILWGAPRCRRRRRSVSRGVLFAARDVVLVRCRRILLGKDFGGIRRDWVRGRHRRRGRVWIQAGRAPAKRLEKLWVGVGA